MPPTFHLGCMGLHTSHRLCLALAVDVDLDVARGEQRELDHVPPFKGDRLHIGPSVRSQCFEEQSAEAERTWILCKDSRL